MRRKTDNTDFIRFLKDEKFIEWKLFPTDELNRYWEEFQQQFPDERKNIALAEKHFRYLKLSSYKMPQEKREEAMKRLEQSLRIYNQRRKIRRFVYTAAACAAALVLSFFYIQKNLNQSQDEMMASAHRIVGNELDSEDILFITGDQTTSFQENIDIEINNDRTAQIKAGNSAREKISIAQHAMNKLIIPYGKRSKIVLADGTQVWLNSGSTLEFPSEFTRDSRDVYLSGEMYIEVAPQKKRSFYVHTSGFNVKVYGTKFNVSSYAGSFSSVVLVEGSVSLQSADKQELFLSPNDQAVYSEEGIFNKQQVDIAQFISWKDGYLMFEDTPIVEALKQIEKYYNLSFNFDDNVSFQGLTCTGKIILSENLDNVMTTLALISSTKYRREDKLIYIYKE
jgi:Fe2+-dicitrate sensor, membrane component